MESMSSQQEALDRQLERVKRRLARTQLLDQNNKVRTLAVVGGGIFLTIVGLATVHLLGFIFLLATALGFYLLARFQPNVNQSVLRYQVWLRLLQAQKARLALDWDGMPPYQRVKNKK
ncbi:hypothetical protein [Dictyobacter kobayashii]|uniref:Uncharacterized protein n=1 Tax=Dictyobacter kobayashii TaxID=2014872 RepID=A0A402AB85_9CHLR|nr:hypothetical protein [Dictyobacter kobayashii]GCE16368.1 hypothetical protein KDK_01680 [Dictyobacter kobayashii]